MNPDPDSSYNLLLGLQTLSQVTSTAMQNVSAAQVITYIVLLALSGFFSASETALISISKIRLRNMVDEKVKNADLVLKVTEQPAKLLSAILIGNNIVNIGASSLSTVIATNIFGSTGVGIATGITTIAVLICGEITPKTYAKENCEKMSLLVIKPIAFCMFIFTPFIYILNFVTSGIFKLLGTNTEQNTPTVTESEFRTMVDVSHEEGIIESPEREMITNVVDFGSTKAENVMIPRTEITAIPLDATFHEVVGVFKENQFTRLPVYNETLDNIVGILSFKDIMLLDDTTNFKIENFMREPYFTYESKPCSQLFSIMRTNSLRMAIVLDEYGGTAGLVTLQDMIEEIVGDILEDDQPEQDEIVPINDGEYIVEALTRLDDVNDMLNINLQSDNVETVGGYVLGLLGRFPEKGESVTDGNIVFKIEEAEKNRIIILRIYINNTNDDDTETED